MREFAVCAAEDGCSADVGDTQQTCGAAFADAGEEERHPIVHTLITRKEPFRELILLVKMKRE